MTRQANEKTRPGLAAGAGQGLTFNDRNKSLPRYPAYGKLLAERNRWNNKPKSVIICTGGDAWQRAKNWQRHPNFAALVLTPEQSPNKLQWPLKGCLCLVEWDKAAPETLIIELVNCLRRAGALNIGVQPMWINHNEPSHLFDTSTQTFIQIRECLKIYRPRKEVRNVAR
ncbi:MAG: hypothetical protein WCH01_16960 [Methylococcaceae bacterium]